MSVDMNLQQIDVTGCRIVGAITKELGHDGPKHHGVVLGRSPANGEVYIAELMNGGHQVSTYTDFSSRYSPNGAIVIQPNDGALTGLEVAKRALSELTQGGSAYDLLANNCKSFVNRAMHNKSSSSQVVNTALGVAIAVGLVYVLKKSK